MKKITAKIRWLIDHGNSEIAFKMNNTIISHSKFVFKTFDASILTISQDFSTAKIALWIDTSSISSGDAAADRILKGTEFLNVRKYKQIIFTSNIVERPDRNERFRITGYLKIQGNSKPVKFLAEPHQLLKDNWKNDKVKLSISGNINLRDWGYNLISSNKSGLSIENDDVTINCNFELIKQDTQELIMLFVHESISSRELNHSDSLVLLPI